MTVNTLNSFVTLIILVHYIYFGDYTKAMKPVNGQIVDDVSKLGSLLDMNGKPLKFEQNKDVTDDVVYFAKGSDNKTYSAQLQKKSLIVGIYDTPEEKKEKKAIEERGEKIRQGEPITGKLNDADSAEKDEPEKEEGNNKDKDKKNNKKKF